MRYQIIPLSDVGDNHRCACWWPPSRQMQELQNIADILNSGGLTFCATYPAREHRDGGHEVCLVDTLNAQWRGCNGEV